MFNSALNAKKLTNEYVQIKQQKAEEEIKFLKSFTQWPIARVKKITQNNEQALSPANINEPKTANKIEHKILDNKLHYLPLSTGVYIEQNSTDGIKRHTNVD